ncbi:Hypothetical_protein [Hexamita inflata]|uniref:Hypothetical_protein n=1 Tax=Hexamita inflata TaxID=28002 RepID=A0AA86TBR7_9EUKA|nr:Hypothetical protein HINF_LOCUS2054 [Hexamita inflata]
MFQSQYIGREPYTICVWFRYIYNLEISRAATLKQQIIFEMQVVYRSGPADVMKRRTTFCLQSALGHFYLSSVSFIAYSRGPEILNGLREETRPDLAPAFPVVAIQRRLCLGCPESQKVISGNEPYL